VTQWPESLDPGRAPPTDVRWLPAWISPAQFSALADLVGFLDDARVPYAVSGGLAGNLAGSQWPLHDIDVDVPAAALPLLAQHYAPWILSGPGAYEDEEFALQLLQLRLPEVGIDIAAAESIVLRDPQGRLHSWPSDLASFELRTLGPLSVRVHPLSSIRAYKRMIDRTADLADLDRLAATMVEDRAAG